MGGGDIQTLRALRRVVVTSVYHECSDRRRPVGRQKIKDSFTQVAERAGLRNGNLVGAPHIVDGVTRARLAYYYMRQEAAEQVWGGAVSRSLIEPMGGAFGGMVWADDLLVDALVRQLCPDDNNPPPPPSPVFLPAPIPKGEPALVAVKAVVGAGALYAAYRVVRMIPSVVVPPLWPTIPANAVIP